MKTAKVGGLIRKLDKIKEKRYSFTQSLRFLVATVVKLAQKKSWVFLKPNAPIGARSLVMFFSHKNRGQSLATIAVLVTAITLAGCGGGGGSGSGVTPPPPLVPVNAVMTVTVTPSDGASDVARDSNVVMIYSVTSGSYTSTTGTLSCDGTSFVLAQTTDATGKKVTFSPSAVLPYGSTCIAQGVATASGENGGSQANISWKSTFLVEQLVCKTGEEVRDGVCVPVPQAWWPPKAVSSIGTQVIGANAIASTSLLIGDTAWQQYVRDGVIKFVDTGMVLTGLSDKPLVWAYYISWDGTYCTRPVFKDTGLGLLPNTSLTYGGCYTDPINWVVGTNNGIIKYAPQFGKCFQETWLYNKSNDALSVTNTEIACPFR